MTREILLSGLNLYKDTWVNGSFSYPSYTAAEESGIWETFRDFIAANKECFERSLAVGHVTGSGLVTNPAMDKVLLTLHGKLNKWLQLGGHADGDPLPHQVALRECQEESGLKDFQFLRWEAFISGMPLDQDPLPFDLDYHVIPARKNEPEHLHFDFRYVLIADDAAPLCITAESKELRWLPIDLARTMTNERSMHRQFDKLTHLKEHCQALSALNPQANADRYPAASPSHGAPGFF